MLIFSLQNFNINKATYINVRINNRYIIITTVYMNYIQKNINQGQYYCVIAKYINYSILLSLENGKKCL